MKIVSAGDAGAFVIVLQNWKMLVDRAALFQPSATVAEVATEIAGVAKPSLYREFGDEDGLTAAVLQAYADAVLSQVLRIVTGPESFDQKVEDLIRYASEDVLSDNGCLYVKMQAATHRFGEKTQALIAAIDAGAEEAYAALLTDARRTGHAPESIPTRLGARYMMSQITLALVLRAAGEEPLLVRDLLTLALSVFRSDKQDRH